MNDEIRLVRIDQDNWEDAIELPVAEDHKQFVASNLYSIAEAQFSPGVNTYGIYKGEKMIGFAMYGAGLEADDDDDEDDYPGTEFWIWRFMIAEGYRFKGYGKEAMKQIINEAKGMGRKRILLSTGPTNEKAILFYKSLGFSSTGVIKFDEEVFILTWD